MKKIAIDVMGMDKGSQVAVEAIIHFLQMFLWFLHILIMCQPISTWFALII